MVEKFVTCSEKVEGSYSAESEEAIERSDLARIAWTCCGHTREPLAKVTHGFEDFEPDKGKDY